MFVAYVEKYVAPLPGSRGYSFEVCKYSFKTEIEAYNMVKQLENDWQSKGNDKSSFYCGVRHELSV